MTFQDVSGSEGVIVVGNINLDIKTTPITASPKLFEDGETSVDEVYESLGGGGANVAVATALLGGKAHFVGCVGKDELGRKLGLSLGAYGVTPHLIPQETTTGRSINLVWDNHHRHFISSLPHTRLLSVREIPFAALAQSECRYLFRADVWFADEMLRGGNEKLFRWAHELKIEVSVDINWDPVWSQGGDSALACERRELLAKTLPLVDWAHGNELELQNFTGCSSLEECCEWLIAHGCGGVIIHRGEEGAAYATNKTGLVKIPAVRVDSVVCETGTGDVFTAAFFVHASLPMEERLARCCEAASRHLDGTRSLIPRLK